MKRTGRTTFIASVASLLAIGAAIPLTLNAVADTPTRTVENVIPTSLDQADNVSLPASGSMCTETAAHTFACDVYASVGSVTANDGATTTTVPIWGFSLKDQTPLNTGALPAQLGGVDNALIFDQGDDVTITLHNDLPAIAGDVALVFPSVKGAPDTTGAPTGGVATYKFIATAVGTSRYEAGLTANGPRQVAMGLAAPMIVRPTGCTSTTTKTSTGTITPACAYDTTNVADSEALLAVASVDPALNNLADPKLNPAGDPRTFDMMTYRPRYLFVNGLSYPSTQALTTEPGLDVLLRQVNLGVSDHAFGFVGLRQLVLGRDGVAVTDGGTLSDLAFPGENPANPGNQDHTIESLMLEAGHAADTVIKTPMTATQGANYPFIEMGQNRLGFQSAAFGGGATFVSVFSNNPPKKGTPLVTGVSIKNGTCAAGTDVAVTSGGTDLTLCAQVAVKDNTGASYAGTPDQWQVGVNTIPSTTDASVGSGKTLETAISSATLGALTNGTNTFWVRAHDVTNGWGASHGISLELNRVGVAIDALSVIPNALNGSENGLTNAAGSINGVDGIKVTGTASTVTLGGGAITKLRYSIDGGPAVEKDSSLIPSTYNPNHCDVTQSAAVCGDPNFAANATASFELDITAANLLKSPGVHTIAIDGFNADTAQWSSDAVGYVPSTIQYLVADTAGPTTSDLTVNPLATNGTVGAIIDTSFYNVVRINAKALAPVAATWADGGDAFAPVAVAKLYPDWVVNTAPGATTAAKLDYLDSKGLGVEMVPADGKYGPVKPAKNDTESVYGDLPLPDVAAQTAGAHTVYVRAQDVAGNVGAEQSVVFYIDKTGPDTTVASAVNNGGGIHITASALDPVITGSPALRSSVVAAEFKGSWEIDPLLINGAGQLNANVNGSGTPLTVTQADSNTAASLVADLTVAQLNALPPSNTGAVSTYNVYIHAKDASGNWGPWTTATFVKNFPTVVFSFSNVGPYGGNPPAAGVNINGTATASGNPTPTVTAARWIGSWQLTAANVFDPATGIITGLTPTDGTAMTAVAPATFPASPIAITGNIDRPTLLGLPRFPAPQVYTVYVQAQDSLGNWGPWTAHTFTR